MNIKNKGFTLIEILITLAIVITLVVSAFFIYKKAVRSYEVNTTIQGLSAISNSIKEMFAGNNGGKSKGFIINSSEAALLFKDGFVNKDLSSIDDQGNNENNSTEYKYYNKSGDFFVSFTGGMDGEPDYGDGVYSIMLRGGVTYIFYSISVPTDNCPAILYNLLKSRKYTFTNNQGQQENFGYADSLAALYMVGYSYKEMSMSDAVRMCKINKMSDIDYVSLRLTTAV